MRPTGLRNRLAHVAAAGMVAAGLAATAGAAPAQAASCVGGSFCYYSSTYQSGSSGRIYYYQEAWARLPSLVDNSESTHNAQWVDNSCGTPQVFFSDTYLDQRTTARVAYYHDQRINTFNTISTNNGYKNMNNLFNDYRNLCR